MRKLYNLKEFLNIYSTEDIDLINTYIESDNRPLKENEVEDLKSLINLLKLNYKSCEGFFLSYEVPHIGHEIDLLKVTDNAILNIELKSKSSPDSCVKCYTMFLPFLLIKIDVFS